jgi:hypothetical protein
MSTGECSKTKELVHEGYEELNPPLDRTEMKLGKNSSLKSLQAIVL